MSMKKYALPIVAVILAACMLFIIANQISTAMKLQDQLETEFKTNLSYVMTSYNWNREDNELYINGYIRNNNTQLHLTRLELLFIAVSDDFDQRIGVHFLSDAKDFKLPQNGTLPYNFRVFLSPDSNADDFSVSQYPNLTLMIDCRVGRCDGPDCRRCCPDPQRSQS